jgi:hypothetical protein
VFTKAAAKKRRARVRKEKNKKYRKKKLFSFLLNYIFLESELETSG